jgi:hypothetical protein
MRTPDRDRYKDSGGWTLYFRFSIVTKGCVAYIGRLPDIGDVFNLMSASVKIIEPVMGDDSATHDAFCDPDRPLVVTAVEPNVDSTNATVYVRYHEPKEKSVKT